MRSIFLAKIKALGFCCPKAFFNAFPSGSAEAAVILSVARRTVRFWRAKAKPCSYCSKPESTPETIPR